MKRNNEVIKKIEAISLFLDQRFKGPWGMGFGWDALLGLVPGVGDLVTTTMSLYILAMAVSLGAGPSILIRMGINILIETVVDVIPVVGNLVDFYWKANLKNLELLKRHVENPVMEAIKSRVIISLISICLIAILVLSAVLTFRFIRFVLH